MEALKMVGALAWVFGVILLFTVPPLGAVVILIAILLSAQSVIKTKERRHQELLDK